MFDFKGMEEKSIAIVVSHPIQHWTPVYKHLADSDNVRLKVFFVAENGAYDYFDAQFNRTVKWDVPLVEGYDHKFLIPGNVIDDYGFRTVDFSEINSELEEFSPDLVWINGYAALINWRIVFNRIRNYKIVFTSDSNLDDKRSSFTKLVKHVVVSWFFKRCDFFLSCGPRNREYLEHYGVRSSDIVDSNYPINNAYFNSQRIKIAPDQIDVLKDSLGIASDHKVLLFSGKLIEHKRAQDAIEAMTFLKDLKVSLLVMGSGSQESRLRDKVQSLGLDNRVKFLGFVNQGELVQYFLLSDLLVFPSSKEPFGAIASEVLQFGLPIVASKNIGAVGASIIPGKNSLIYECGDVEQLAQRIRDIVLDDNLYEELSAGSVSLAADVDCSLVSQRLVSILHRL